MSPRTSARRCSFRSLYGVAVFVAALAACEQGTNEGPASPTSKSRPPDRTEVTMEVTPFDASAEEMGFPTSGGGPGGASPTASGGSSDDPADDPNIGGPQEPSVEKGVAPIRPRLRACYKKALTHEPSLAGSATFDTTLGKDGKVTAARFVKRDGLNEDMVGCLLAAVKTASFDPAKKTQIVTFTFGRPAAAAAAGGGDAGAKP